MSTRHTVKKKAFTLIELLIVIAIIALLAAILFPVFSRAREKARASVCMSNLKQIGLGLMQYTQDYDERMTRSCYVSDGSSCTETSTGENTASNRYKWMDAIYPYVKGEGIFVCPSAANKTVNFTGTQEYNPAKFEVRGGAAANGTGNFPRIFGSYSINNAYPSVTDYTVHGPVGWKISAMASPATTFLVTDGNGNYSFGPALFSSLMELRTDLDPPMFKNGGGGIANFSSGILMRHQEFANVLYCDGHVKAVKPTELAETECVRYNRFGAVANIYTNLTVEEETPASGC